MVDSLTGLDGYDTFINTIQKVREDIGDKVIPLVYTDIKHFKYFNDTYGYKRGNELLARMAQLVSANKDEYICGSRVVSDNIVTAGYVEGLSVDELFSHIYGQVGDIEQKLRKEFNCNRIRLASGVYFLTKDNLDIDPETAVSNANLARKQAKEPGAKSVVVFRKEMADNINRELEILASVDDAIENRELKAFYQPKVDSETGEITGAEALVRWEKPDHSFVYPDQFIPAIEKSGQIIDVDYFMYEEVFSFIREKLDAGESIVPISMNVSRQHLKNLEIIEFIRGLMEKYEIPPEYLEFELTESVCMEDSDRVMEFIDAFHDMGITVSMDDFGSGYSSLNLLSEMPIDIIKLDRCFLHSALMEKKERVIISSIINMTKELEMRSLCEGVETVQQSEFLKSIGCDAQQGYLHSKPITKEAFEEVLRKSR